MWIEWLLLNWLPQRNESTSSTDGCTTTRPFPALCSVSKVFLTRRFSFSNWHTSCWQPTSCLFNEHFVNTYRTDVPFQVPLRIPAKTYIFLFVFSVRPDRVWRQSSRLDSISAMIALGSPARPCPASSESVFVEYFLFVHHFFSCKLSIAKYMHSNFERLSYNHLCLNRDVSQLYEGHLSRDMSNRLISNASTQSRQTIDDSIILLNPWRV